MIRVELTEAQSAASSPIVIRADGGLLSAVARALNTSEGARRGWRGTAFVAVDEASGRVLDDRR